uniref:Uncharacterized protein n=1 Tax=Rhizophora mucronata TaxID=61149 RepID=A0A2P2R0U7_RHIMU
MQQVTLMQQVTFLTRISQLKLPVHHMSLSTLFLHSFWLFS